MSFVLEQFWGSKRVIVEGIQFVVKGKFVVEVKVYNFDVFFGI